MWLSGVFLNLHWGAKWSLTLPSVEPNPTVTQGTNIIYLFIIFFWLAWHYVTVFEYSIDTVRD